MSSSSPSIRNTVSDKILQTAVAQLVRAAAAAGELAELSARRIRQTLETEFACDLRTRRDLIACTIQATLDNLPDHRAVNRDIIGATSAPKRRKLSRVQDDADELVYAFGAELPKRAQRTQATAAAPALLVVRPFACNQCDYRSARKDGLAQHKRAHSGPAPVHIQVSSAFLENALARLVRAAVDAREELSARGIRQTLEAVLACGLTSRKDLILCAIQATLEEEVFDDEPAGFNAVEAKSSTTRRKVSILRLATHEHDGNELPKRARRSQTTTGGAVMVPNRAHVDERPFACDECDYRCAKRSHLTRHHRMHSGERPFACDECDYRGANRSHLTTHKRTHSGERPYACDECDHRFASRALLTRHHRMHSGERPFACDKCDFRCSRNDNLTAHKRTHSDERPYACDKCDYRGAHTGALTLHKRINCRKRR